MENGLLKSQVKAYKKRAVKAEVKNEELIQYVQKLKIKKPLTIDIEIAMLEIQCSTSISSKESEISDTTEEQPEIIKQPQTPKKKLKIKQANIHQSIQSLKHGSNKSTEQKSQLQTSSKPSDMLKINKSPSKPENTIALNPALPPKAKRMTQMPQPPPVQNKQEMHLNIKKQIANRRQSYRDINKSERDISEIIRDKCRKIAEVDGNDWK